MGEGESPRQPEGNDYQIASSLKGLEADRRQAQAAAAALQLAAKTERERASDEQALKERWTNRSTDEEHRDVELGESIADIDQERGPIKDWLDRIGPQLEQTVQLDEKLTALDRQIEANLATLRNDPDIQTDPELTTASQSTEALADSTLGDQFPQIVEYRSLRTQLNEALGELEETLRPWREQQPDRQLPVDHRVAATQLYDELEAHHQALTDRRDELYRNTSEGRREPIRQASAERLEAITALTQRIAERHRQWMPSLRGRILTNTTLIGREDVAETQMMPRPVVEAILRQELQGELENIYQQLARVVDPHNLTEITTEEYRRRLNSARNRNARIEERFQTFLQEQMTAAIADPALAERYDENAHQYAKMAPQDRPPRVRQAVFEWFNRRGLASSDSASSGPRQPDSYGTGKIRQFLQSLEQSRDEMANGRLANDGLHDFHDLSNIELYLTALEKYLEALPQQLKLDDSSWRWHQSDFQKPPQIGEYDIVKRMKIRPAGIQQVVKNQAMLTREAAAATKLLDQMLAAEWAQADQDNFRKNHPGVQGVQFNQDRLIEITQETEAFLTQIVPAARAILERYLTTDIVVEMADDVKFPTIHIRQLEQQQQQTDQELAVQRLSTTQLKQQVEHQRQLVAESGRGFLGIGNNRDQRQQELTQLQTTLNQANEQEEKLLKESDQLTAEIATIRQGLMLILDRNFYDSFRPLTGTQTIDTLCTALVNQLRARVDGMQLDPELVQLNNQYQALISHADKLKQDSGALNQAFRKEFESFFNQTNQAAVSRA